MSLEINIRQKLSCPKHPRYNPENGGEGAIKAGCEICSELLQLWKAAASFRNYLFAVGRRIVEARK